MCYGNQLAEQDDGAVSGGGGGDGEGGGGGGDNSIYSKWVSQLACLMNGTWYVHGGTMQHLRLPLLQHPRKLKQKEGAVVGERKRWRRRGGSG